MPGQDIEIGGLGTIGVITDTDAYRVPPEAWTTATNMRVLDGAMTKLGGWAQIFGTPGVAPHFAMAVRTASASFWLYTSLTKAYGYDGTTHTNITRQSVGVDVNYTASNTYEWNGTLLADIPILNNGIDVPQFWSPISLATKMQDLTNWPSTLRAKVVRAFGPYLMAIGISKSGTAFPHTVKWSHPADPGSVPSSWDETDPTTDAGETPLPDVNAGVLVDMLPLGDTMYIYKENSVRKARFIGGRDIFDFGKSAWLETTGLLAARCVTITGDGTKQVWASQDDILWHDGNRVRSVLTRKRRRELFNLIDTANFQNSFMFTNPLFGEVIFCFPPSGQSQATRAYIFNYLAGDDQWPITDMDGVTFRNATIGPIQGASDEQWNQGTDTWDDDTGPWSTLERRRVVLCGTDATKFYNLDSGATRDGTTFTGTLQRLGLSLLGRTRTGEWVVDFDRWKMYDTIWPKLSGGSVSIRVGVQELVNGPVTWKPATVFNPATGPKIDAGPVSGRALAYEFSSTESFRLDGLKMVIQDLGMF